MSKIIPLTMMAVCVLGVPVFAQDEAPPGMDEFMGRAERFMQRVEELVQPLIEKFQETLRELISEFQEWMGEVDPGDLFGEFDGEQWIEQLKRLFKGLPGMDEEDDEDEEFLSVRAVEC